jgi:dTDP-4-amino-4,6-dideoxygalactose transaminase
LPLKVPLLDLQKQNAELEPRLTEVFARVLKSGQFIGGPEVECFEKAVATLLGVSHAIGVSSGTDAILLALMALVLDPGDEVICPSFTIFAPVNNGITRRQPYTRLV